MPKYVCEGCGCEFWGWGVRYVYRSGSSLVCPECSGALVETPIKDVEGDAA